MNEAARVLIWDELESGAEVSIPFRITKDDMQAFSELSGDRSRIHIDPEFARSRGFKDVVVYGALTVARLSYLVGMHLPGDFGLATSWRIDFNHPLYVDEDAVLSATVTHLSVATRTIKLKFRATAGGRVVATGTADSMLLDQPKS